jgi:MFS family permease
MKGYAHNTGKLSFKPFFRDKKLMTMLVYMIVIQFSVGYMFNFVGVYVTAELGYDQWVWGAITFFSIIGEYAFFFVYDKIFKRFGTEKLLVFSAAMLVLRFLCVGLFKSPVILILSSILFGSFMTVLNYCATSYVNRTAPDELRASGQTFMYALGLSFPRFLSGALGGIMTDSFGVRVSMIIISGIIALLTITSPLQPLWDKKGINTKETPDKL